MNKTARQRRIADLLTAHRITSQAGLVELLAAEGTPSTQATVSRDLEELGAVKIRVPRGEAVYAIPERPHQQIAPEDQLRRVLGEWVADVRWSGNLVVVRTPPGSAHVVGSAIDRAGLDGVLGTVAGDDTVLIVTSSPTGGPRVGRRIGQFANISTEKGTQ